ncbi:hypothetical protein JTB14_009054 [Gonioctena quinquepunctata]|nr:hypothetical protein JTB14_009054 [Gonioctena quinquepunctata]
MTISWCRIQEGYGPLKMLQYPLVMLRMLIWSVLVIHSTNAIVEIDPGHYLSGIPSYSCDIKNEEKTDIHCYGQEIVEIPQNLSTSLKRLTVTDCSIVYIHKNSFYPYRKQIRDITLSGMPYLRVIEAGTFANMPELRTLYISYARQIRFLHGLLRGVTSSTFYSLRIVWTHLTEIPDLVDLPSNNTMFLLDLDHNHIERLPANSIKLSAQQVTINFNRLTTVDDYTFNGSQISELYMHSNLKLRNIGENAFKGLKSLRLLDLSHTAISSLPITGLEELETLKLEATQTLKTIPSIYDLRNLREARLTHSFHCCAFKYPAQHNPEKHALFEQSMKNICKELEKSRVQGFVRRRRSMQPTNSKIPPKYYSYGKSLTMRKKNLTQQTTIGQYNDLWAPLRGRPIISQGNVGDFADSSFEDSDSESDESYVDGDEDGFFHSGVAEVSDSQLDAYCGKIIFRVTMRAN